MTEKEGKTWDSLAGSSGEVGWSKMASSFVRVLCRGSPVFVSGSPFSTPVCHRKQVCVTWIGDIIAFNWLPPSHDDQQSVTHSALTIKRLLQAAGTGEAQVPQA